MSHGIFPTGWATCPHTKKIKLKLLVVFLNEILSLKNKSCVIEKMPGPTLLFRLFASHSYNSYVKIVFASTRQTKLKKIWIKQKHVIRIIFYVNEETRARPSFRELNICQINLLSVFISMQRIKRSLTMCMKPDFLKTSLKEPDGFSKYV